MNTGMRALGRALTATWISLIGCSVTPAHRGTGALVDRDPPGNSTTALETARRLHLRGVEGDEAAAVRALELLESLEPGSPESPLLLAYLGSARVLEARRFFLPWKKGEALKRGLPLLDRAVELAPGSWEVRFFRAVSTHPLPSFIGKVEQCREDLDWLIRHGDRVRDGGEARAAELALVHLHRASLHSRTGDVELARQDLQEAIRLAPGSQPAREATDRLASLPPSEEDAP